jgi:hypothetical protein
MKSGYHQESHKQRTAFTVGPVGFYEFNRLPSGLVNIPVTYQTPSFFRHKTTFDDQGEWEDELFLPQVAVLSDHWLRRTSLVEYVDALLEWCVLHQVNVTRNCQPTDRAVIPDDLDIAPSLVSYQYRNNQLVPIHISNITTRTITGVWCTEHISELVK